jgi:hypothetical protein
VDFDGQRLAFGPADEEPVTVNEFFTFPTPVNPDWADSNTNVACRFATTAPGDFIGVRYWRPPTYSPNGTVFGVNEDTGAVIANPVAEAVDGIRGAFVELLFAAPAPIVPGVNYLAAYHTSRYGFTRVTEGATIPFLTEHLYTDPVSMAAVSKFRFGGELTGGAFSSAPNFHFNVSPIVRFTS